MFDGRSGVLPAFFVCSDDMPGLLILSRGLPSELIFYLFGFAPLSVFDVNGASVLRLRTTNHNASLRPLSTIPNGLLGLGLFFRCQTSKDVLDGLSLLCHRRRRCVSIGRVLLLLVARRWSFDGF